MWAWRLRRGDGTTRGELRHRADLALRAARRRGRGVVTAFSPDMEAEFEEQSFIKRELARALAARAFDVHYQPIVKADGGAIVGVEALLRWNHPIRGDIPPAVFTRVAEAAGLMDQLGEFVLRRALADAGALAAPLRGGQPVTGAGARSLDWSISCRRCSTRPRSRRRASCSR